MRANSFSKGNRYQCTSKIHTLHNVCAVHWGMDIMSTVGDTMSTPGGVQYTGGYHEYSGNTMSTPGGVQYTGGYHEYTGASP